MTLTSYKFFFGIIGFLFIANLLVNFDIQFLQLRAIFSFIFLITIPGLLIILVFKIEKIGFWEYLVYTIGLSITFLMLCGLITNWLLPQFGISQPLSLQPISLTINCMTLVFWQIAYLRNQDQKWIIRIPSFSLFNWIYFVIPVIFPVLSILGAVSLNNGNQNDFTMIMLGGIGLHVFILFVMRKKLNSSLYPLAIFFIALSLLFMTSMRGWYTTGHDNQQEYYVFQLTKVNYYWNIALFRDAYYACLSLNILPTIFSSFLNISDVYIFKILFQAITSFTAIAIFLFFSKYSSKITAFLSTFYFLSFPTFLNDLPMLNRQEIALLFFALMLLVLSCQAINSRLKEFLFLIFGGSMIISHYSTSYVAIALFCLTYILSFFYRQKSFSKRIRLGILTHFLTWRMVLGLILLTFFWNIQLTKTSAGLLRLITETAQNIGHSFSQDLKSTNVLYSFFNWKKQDKTVLFNEYIQKTIQEKIAGEDPDLYYEKKDYELYQPILSQDEVLPPTSIGILLKNFSLDPYYFNYYLRQGIAKIIQLFIFVGFMAMVVKKSIAIKKLDSEYIIFVFSSIALLMTLIILPMFSIEYGVLRFFQQTLTILALPTMVGCVTICSFLGKKTGSLVSASVFVIFFWSLSGFIPQLTGNYYPLLNLNNQGIYYDAYYLHKTEVESLNWLFRNYNQQSPIHADMETGSKMLSIANLPSSGKMLPAILPKDAYVYLDYSNVKTGKYIIDYKGDIFSYTYPTEFLKQHKNLIYNNSGSQIYK